LPPDNQVRLLVTRPEPECERTARALRGRGHEVLVLPLLRIEALADADLGSGPWAAIIFTSANAVRGIAAHRRFGELAGVPAYVVGTSTRTAAMAAGFAEVRSAGGALVDLVRLIVGEPPAARLPLLYPAGREHTGDLAEELRPHGWRVDTVIIYRAVMVEQLPPPICAALAAGEVEAVLHYSARTAQAFLAAAAAAGIDGANRFKHLCLSSAVAAPLVAAGAENVQVAVAPKEEALFACIGAA
jgi:uroporphyrinogen-III synthase